MCLKVYGTGMLEFTLFLAFVFGLGVCCGVSTWFYLLLSLLKKYKKVGSFPICDIIQTICSLVSTRSSALRTRPLT